MITLSGTIVSCRKTAEHFAYGPSGTEYIISESVTYLQDAFIYMRTKELLKEVVIVHWQV